MFLRLLIMISSLMLCMLMGAHANDKSPEATLSQPPLPSILTLDEVDALVGEVPGNFVGDEVFGSLWKRKRIRLYGVMHEAMNRINPRFSTMMTWDTTTGSAVKMDAAALSALKHLVVLTQQAVETMLSGEVPVDALTGKPIGLLSRKDLSSTKNS